MSDVPAIDHPAQFLARAVDEGLFLLAELRRREFGQSIPVGHAGKQLALPPDRARVERLALGIGHGGQQLSIDLERRPGDFFPPELGHVGHDQHGEAEPQQNQREEIPGAVKGVNDDRGAGDNGRGE